MKSSKISDTPMDMVSFQVVLYDGTKRSEEFTVSTVV
jgi:hypothetical protein